MIYMLQSLAKHRAIIWSLAKNDIKARYLGSVLGVLWVFLLPIVNLLVMWFAFQFGLKAQAQNGVPFILWLMPGLFCWNFFADAVNSSTNSIIEKSFLVKKVVFNVELLPVIKITASALLYVFLILVMIVVFLCYGVFPDLYWLQIFYYTFCLVFLTMALTWLTSSAVVFYRDFGQIVSVALQIGFWATPVFWSPAILPERLRFITVLNPVGYVVSGYRDSLISKRWFWELPFETCYFWSIAIFIFYVGLFIFRRLRPHFADVL